MKYYLCNGKDGYGNALNVAANSKLTRDFPDIASIDLTTMEIPISNVNVYFKGLNPNNDLSGTYYICTKNLSSIYIPVFKPNNLKANMYIQELKKLAESRCDNLDKKHKVGTLNRKDAEYISRRVLTDIYRLDDNKFNGITNTYASISNNIQEGIILRNYDKDRAKTDMEYINRFILHDYRNQITSYTVIRNLVLAYSRLIDNQDIRLNRDEIRNGYTDFTGKNEVVKQLSLFDYM